MVFREEDLVDVFFEVDLPADAFALLFFETTAPGAALGFFSRGFAGFLTDEVLVLLRVAAFLREVL